MNRCLTGLRRSVRAQVSCTFSVAQSLFLMGSSVRCAEFFLFFVAQSHPLSCRASKIIFFSFSDGCSATVTCACKIFFLSRCQLLVRSLHAQHFFIFFDPSIPWRAQYSFFFLFACCRSAGQPVRAKLFFFGCACRSFATFPLCCHFPAARAVLCFSLLAAGQQDSRTACARQIFLFFIFFSVSSRARRVFFFQSLLVCVPLFLSGQQGCACRFFFGCACRVRSLLLCWALPSFFLDTSALFGHFSQPSKRVRAPCIFFFLPPSTAVCAAFLFL